MIKGLMGDAGIMVSGGNTSVPYINQNINNPMQGMIRVNGTDMQVFDGNNWVNMNTSYATVSLDAATQELLQWARTQRTLEMNRAVLIKNNPALEKAHAAILRAEANFDILSKFVQDDKPTEQVGAWTTSMSVP